AALAAFRGSVHEARSAGRRSGRPLWQRLYLDVLALAVSGLVYWLTARTGFSAVVNPDSNPTLSLSVYMFLAPALLWLGAALLLSGCVAAWSRGLPGASPADVRRRRPGSCSRVPAAAAVRSTADCSCSDSCSRSA